MFSRVYRKHQSYLNDKIPIWMGTMRTWGTTWCRFWNRCVVPMRGRRPVPKKPKNTLTAIWPNCRICATNQIPNTASHTTVWPPRPPATTIVRSTKRLNRPFTNTTCYRRRPYRTRPTITIHGNWIKRFRSPSIIYI